MADVVKVQVRYVLRGSVVVDIPRDRYEAIADDETCDDAQLFMDELAERGVLDDGIEEAELESIYERKPTPVRIERAAPSRAGKGDE